MKVLVMNKQCSSVVKCVVLLTVILFLGGCLLGNVKEGPKISEEMISRIKPGETTKKEIIDWFGPPQNYVSPGVFNQILRELDITKEPPIYYSFANILSYQFTQGNVRGLFLILFNYAEVDLRTDHLVVFLDDNDRVKHYGYKKGTAESR
jgi:hypothetical protein